MCYGLVSSFTYFCFILKQKSVINVLLLKTAFLFKYKHCLDDI